jgi:hypothetical protein
MDSHSNAVGRIIKNSRRCSSGPNPSRFCWPLPSWSAWPEGWRRRTLTGSPGRTMLPRTLAEFRLSLLERFSLRMLRNSNPVPAFRSKPPKRCVRKAWPRRNGVLLVCSSQVLRWMTGSSLSSCGSAGLLPPLGTEKFRNSDPRPFTTGAFLSGRRGAV